MPAYLTRLATSSEIWHECAMRRFFADNPKLVDIGFDASQSDILLAIE